MRSNLGDTKLKTRRRQSNALREFDCLPRQLREWLRNAVFPWAPSSAKRVYKRAITDTGDVNFAIAELERLQEHQLSKHKIRFDQDD